MAIKLVATDMDGTFLDERGSFDRARFERILSGLEDRQIPFVVASGNGMERLLKLFEGFEDRIIFVAANGAHLYEKGMTKVQKTLSLQAIDAILNYYKGRLTDYCIMLGTETSIYMQEGAVRPFDGHTSIEPQQLEAFLKRISFLPDLTHYPKTRTVYKAGLWVKEELVDDVVARFNQQFLGEMEAVTSGYGSIDILPAGIHKAWGLEQILKELAIRPEEVLAFGDSDNDLELLSYAGYSYAMANAHERVKRAAKYQAPSHREAGVMTVIEELLFGNK